MIAVSSKIRSVTVFVDDVETITVKQSVPKIQVFMGKATVTAKQQKPTVFVYDDKYIETPAFTYVYGGTPTAGNDIADAGFYNTTSWNTVWNGGFS